MTKRQKYFSKISHSQLFNTLCSWVVMFSIVMFIVATEFDDLFGTKAYRTTEIIILCIFIIEYIIRILGSHKMFKEATKIIMIVDLLTLISMFLSIKIPYLRSFRLIKLTNIFRKKRYKVAAITIKHVWHDQKEEIFLTSIIFGLLIFVSANFMHSFEGHLQHSLSSVPRAVYWAVITATSVGYGDVVPITSIGKLIAIVTSTLGILTYSMITVIFATGFSKEWKNAQKYYESKHENDKK